MPVGLHKKIIRGHPYWYARECQRVKGKPTITVMPQFRARHRSELRISK